MASFSSSGGHEPMPRYRHASAPVGNKVLMCCGVTEDFSEQTKERLSTVVDIFDPQNELWEEKQTTGDLPVPGVRGMASASFGDDFFMFGGVLMFGYPGKWVKSLLRLDTKTYRWSELSGPRNPKANSPMAKSGASMVACGDYLAVFAGYGIPDGPTQPGSSFIVDAGYTDGRGATNEFHIFNLNQGMHDIVHLQL